MTTQLLAARSGLLTEAMSAAAGAEGVPPEKVMEEIALGRAVLPANPRHGNLRPLVAGRAFRTKVNANIGLSPEKSSREQELVKLQAALDAGADLVMDLSVGADLRSVRQSIIEACSVPLGTVPIYEALARSKGGPRELSEDTLLEVISDQASQGVDFMTLHAGILREHVPLAARRKLGIASRGGAILAEWMVTHDRENPFFSLWDRVMDICLEHDITVSLGDGLRPGCLADASDEAQFAELDVLGDLVQRCRERGVQVMVEGPGHVPFGDIQMNMEREQRVCDDAPFYVLGPLVTDVAAGYDHIACAVGATAAAFYGASMLCYVTPAEHLGLPTTDDVRDGVVACRIAAHAADVARGLPGERDRDDAMADARAELDWEKQFSLALDGDSARSRYQSSNPTCESETDHCSMCGKDFCAVRTSKRLRDMV
ncbi:MAG: phosphomethylpyrimidine synthase ThiC [Kiritimatiellia bacterium]|jgi:phosphomethylpyrimidine synthase|nr:phosphomethylpyrimidine synthase ThiC [Kiritimatiellia bacterium]MDP6848376.1 phosphomethylpyrimidine synthase ThiC [Kiritimatiellia bacterium]